jgi:cytochrome c553
VILTLLRQRRYLWGAALLLALLVGVVAAGLRWQARQAGQALFRGDTPLAARIGGHAESLPALATRCSNCHEGAQRVGGVLNRQGLAEARPRRGGPPSRYDAATLCRTLRKGIDPAHVTLPQAMPLYEMTDAQCSALWAYLTSL